MSYGVRTSWSAYTAKKGVRLACTSGKERHAAVQRVCVSRGARSPLAPALPRILVYPGNFMYLSGSKRMPVVGPRRRPDGQAGRYSPAASGKACIPLRVTCLLAHCLSSREWNKSHFSTIYSGVGRKGPPCLVGEAWGHTSFSGEL